MLRARRLARLQRQLPEGLEIVADSVRAGHSLEQACAELGIPFVDTERELQAHRQASGRALEDYYFPAGAGGDNHLTGLGNRVAFGAIQRGIECDYDAPSPAGEAGRSAR